MIFLNFVFHRWARPTAREQMLYRVFADDDYGLAESELWGDAEALRALQRANRDASRAPRMVTAAQLHNRATVCGYAVSGGDVPRQGAVFRLIRT